MAGNEHGPGKPGPQQEESDVNVWAIGRFAFAMVAVVAVCLVLLMGMFRFLENETGGSKPVAQDRVLPGKVPPQPRLEETPVADLRKIREAEEQALKSYGWIDQKKGVVRIPVARAIDLLAQRGLPARQQTEPQTSAVGVSVPTESGLGPKVQQAGGPLAGDAK
jgi:hypothetical protein